MITYLISVLQGYDPLFVSGISLLIYFAFILLFFRLWGKLGLYAYIIIAVIGANFQVIKLSYFGYLDKPIALGTELFATIYLCTDILSEYYGTKAAKQGVYIGFLGMVFWTTITSLTLAFSPLKNEQAGEDYQWAINTHGNMEAIFSVLPVFLVSGLIAYLSSQIFDIWLFDLIKKQTKSKWLWLRNNLSTILSALVDNIIFSTLAFLLLSDHPVDFKTLWLTYILGTYFIRVIIAIFDTPFMYLSKKMKIPDLP